MAKILIIGGGFGGLNCAVALCNRGLGPDVTLIDKRQTLDFLPMLPDCLGRGIEPRLLAYDIEQVSRRRGFTFIRDEIGSIDLAKKRVISSSGEYAFDFLAVSCGAQTNFFGNREFEENAFGLVSVSDAERITAALSQDRFDNFVVVGGGYTGIEAATNLKVYANKRRSNIPVTIIEKGPRILGGLPKWMRAYTENNLKRMGIAVLGGSTVEKLENRSVHVSGGKIFENALVVWSAGVSAGSVPGSLDVGKGPQGRIKVDDCLRFGENCFAIGDAGYFCQKETCLRMAVMFSLAQGRCAAENIFRAIKGRKLRPYRPIDLGYIIPMANNRSCGVVLGVNLSGYLATMLHYTMCVYRMQGLERKVGIIKQLFTVGRVPTKD